MLADTVNLQAIKKVMMSKLAIDEIKTKEEAYKFINVLVEKRFELPHDVLAKFTQSVYDLVDDYFTMPGEILKTIGMSKVKMKKHMLDAPHVGEAIDDLNHSYDFEIYEYEGTLYRVDLQTAELTAVKTNVEKIVNFYLEDIKMKSENNEGYKEEMHGTYTMLNLYKKMYYDMRQMRLQSILTRYCNQSGYMVIFCSDGEIKCCNEETSFTYGTVLNAVKNWLPAIMEEEDEMWADDIAFVNSLL